MAQVKLELSKKNNDEKLGMGDTMLEKMVPNPRFANPLVPYDLFAAGKKAASDAAIKAKFGTKFDQNDLKRKMRAFELLITQQAAFVEGIANATPEMAVEIINEAGLVARTQTKKEIPTLSVKAAKVENAVEVRRKAVKGCAYVFFKTTNLGDDASWEEVMVSTVAKVEITELTSMTRYYFRSALIKGVIRAPFDPIVSIVIA